jgi:hypothetical protein
MLVNSTSSTIDWHTQVAMLHDPSGNADSDALGPLLERAGRIVGRKGALTFAELDGIRGCVARERADLE